MKNKYTAQAARWFDKVNGNTYHSVRVTNNETGETLYCPFQYGYGDQYRQTALQAMYDNKWIPARYGIKRQNGTDDLCMFERDNDYPINWIVTDGLKRDCIANGKS